MHSWICKVYAKFVFGFEGAAIGCSPECNELQEWRKRHHTFFFRKYLQIFPSKEVWCLFLLVGNMILTIILFSLRTWVGNWSKAGHWIPRWCGIHIGWKGFRRYLRRVRRIRWFRNNTVLFWVSENVKYYVIITKVNKKCWFIYEIWYTSIQIK